jgi:hypothetical protein
MYYNTINGINGIYSDKLLFSFLSLLFSCFDKGYILVFAAYSFLTLIFVYKTLLERNALVWGLIIFCFIGFYLDSFDRIRQVLAVAIFLYSIKYIEQKKLSKYCLYIMLAALSHLSALLLLPVYLYNKISVKPIIALSVIFSFFILTLTGVSSIIQVFIYSHIPYYNEIYGNSQFVNMNGGFGTGLGFMLNITLICYSLMLSKNHFVLRNLLFTAGCLMVLAPGNLNIIRFSQYFYVSVMVLFPYTFRDYHHSTINKIVAFCIFFVFFQSQQGRNNYKYNSVFSEDFKLESFSPRMSDRPLLNPNRQQ